MHHLFRFMLYDLRIQVFVFLEYFCTPAETIGNMRNMLQAGKVEKRMLISIVVA